MKRLAIATALLILTTVGAAAQSGCAAIVYGAVLTAAQWNNCFIQKQDALGYTPVNRAGDAMTGPLYTAAATAAHAGLTIPPGVTPTAPNNGDIWSTTAGVYARVNGSTVGPFIGATGAPLSATNDTNVTATLSGVPASALLQSTTITLGWAGTLSVSRGGTGAGTQAAAALNIFPSPTRAGDVVYWNGSGWVALAGNNAGTKVLQETSAGVPSWASAGTGTVTSSTISAGTGVTVSGTCTVTTTGTCTVSQSLTNTSFNTATAAATGTSSGAALMIGAGTNCKLTPTYSGRVQVQFDIAAANQGGATFGAVYSLRYGTGTAPANGAAASGTVAAGPFTTTTASGETRMITMSAVITGLTAGTAYWFDFAQTSNGSVLINPSYDCNGFEF